MKSLGVVILCTILIIVAITIADAQKKAADKKSKSNVNSAGNKKSVGKALKKTSTSKPTTRRRKSSTMLFKTTKKTTGTTASTFILASSFEDDAPDNEAGSDCFDACYPNTSLLTAEGKVRSPENYGKIVETNGKKFLVGTMQLGSWQDNWKTCCSIGMQPLLLTEKTKINDFIAAVVLASIIFFLYTTSCAM
ncbi:uncharacterized protein LOC135941282 [Cloeon dipterum]|uniref:uncharacterized protein LOC135941282 n=1 Tax=Cloeon dipterum TaxID=197152 RepID=UPI00322070F7